MMLSGTHYYSTVLSKSLILSTCVHVHVHHCVHSTNIGDCDATNILTEQVYTGYESASRKHVAGQITHYCHN